jgi:hypothetical protein
MSTCWCSIKMMKSKKSTISTNQSKQKNLTLTSNKSSSKHLNLSSINSHKIKRKRLHLRTFYRIFQASPNHQHQNHTLSNNSRCMETTSCRPKGSLMEPPNILISSMDSASLRITFPSWQWILTWTCTQMWWISTWEIHIHPSTLIISLNNSPVLSFHIYQLRQPIKASSITIFLPMESNHHQISTLELT